MLYFTSLAPLLHVQPIKLSDHSCSSCLRQQSKNYYQNKSIAMNFFNITSYRLLDNDVNMSTSLNAISVSWLRDSSWTSNRLVLHASHYRVNTMWTWMCDELNRAETNKIEAGMESAKQTDGHDSHEHSAVNFGYFCKQTTMAFSDLLRADRHGPS